MVTRTHILVGRQATGWCASRVSSVSVPANQAWPIGYAATTMSTKPVIATSADHVFTDHANLPTRRLKEPSP